MAAFCLLPLPTVVAQTLDYSKWVNPFIGTGGHGHTFPGATMPFGMVQLSPDTRIDNWDGSSGYHYSDDTINGFSHTHLSGTGIPDGCDILLMPASQSYIGGANDKNDPFENGYASKFSHSDEKAEPGYYSVLLRDDSIIAELTSTERVGLHKYTFTKDGKYRIVLNLVWRDKILDSQLRFSGTNRIEGFRKSSSWAKNQTVYYVAEFSKPIKDFGMGVPPSGDGKTFRGKKLWTEIMFDAKANEQVLVKVAISYVSIEGARKNLAAELPGWDFDKVRADAKAAWNKELSKIEVSGGTEAQTTNFYTALYHTMIQPNVFSDVDGQYKGHDGKVHSLVPAKPGLKAERTKPGQKRDHGLMAANLRQRSAAGEQYTVFSLWDTFRAAHPLYTIIDERRTVDFINTFIRQYEQGGRLPVWELWGEETDTMIGYHAVSVIADAMAKGIKGFDYEKAYAAAKHSAELDHFGLKDYKRRGYISMEDEHESVSKTLEYAYNDWCIMEIARVMMMRRHREVLNINDSDYGEKTRTFVKFKERARSFENLFDPTTGFMRPKKNGGWVSPFAPNEVTFNFTEGNSWVYSFFVPHDVSRLMELHGGREKFATKLDELFTTSDKLAGRFQPDITGLIGQYAHGNEPSHHIPYLFNYAGQPWKTQKYVRQIMDEFYKPTPDGLIGNEDCGQMSAWYILSASGFYPVNPGDKKYTIGTPLFPKMTYKLENGKTFTILAKNVSSANRYILRAKLNGNDHKRAWIWHDDIRNGGVLEFSMVDKPTESAFDEFARSGTNAQTVAVPTIEGVSRVFEGKANVTLATITPNAKIYYTVNGKTLPSGEWMLYDRPFEISETAEIKAVAHSDKSVRSFVDEAKFIKKPNNWTVKIEHKYNRQYTGGGDEGLIDGIRGTINFASGEWQGYQPKDLIATIDLQRETTISELGGGFLQNARSWIWMPTRIVFETSMDGVNFTKAAEIKTDIAPTDMKEQIKDYVTKISPTKARYVRVHAYNLGKIPAWHPGAGDDTFIFVDEIIIR